MHRSNKADHVALKEMICFKIFTNWTERNLKIPNSIYLLYLAFYVMGYKMHQISMLVASNSKSGFLVSVDKYIKVNFQTNSHEYILVYIASFRMKKH